MKVDSEADVCCISAEDHRRFFARGCAGTPRQPDWPLHGSDGKRLDVSDSFSATLEHKGRHIDMTMYVLANVATPLLSRLAGTQLSIFARLDTVSDAKQAIINQYPKLFRGLGYMSGNYHIQLKPDAQSYAVYTPRRILLPLMPKVKNEIDRLLSLGVINVSMCQLNGALTEWCAPIVVAPNGPVIRLRVDISQLNDSVMRKCHILPSVDHVLAS